MARSALALAAVLATLCLAAAQQPVAPPQPVSTPGPLDYASIFPDVPAPGIKSVHSLTQEVISWNDLLLFRLLVQIMQIRGLLSLPNPEPPIVFAPVNAAFFDLAAALYPPNGREPSSKDLQDGLLRLLDVLEGPTAPVPVLNAVAQVLAYHIGVPGPAASESSLKDAGSQLTILPNATIDTSAFPVVRDALNRTGTRLGRSIATTRNGNSLLIFIDTVLAPFDVSALSDVLFPSAPTPTVLPAGEEDSADADSPSASPEPGSSRQLHLENAVRLVLGNPSTRQEATETGAPAPVQTPDPPAPFALPLSSYVSFALGRADMQILKAILSKEPAILTAISTFNRTNHLLLPTDTAFGRFMYQLGDPALNTSLLAFANSPLNSTLLASVYDDFIAAVAAIDGAPSLASLLLYHVLDGPESLSARSGPQATALADTNVTLRESDGFYFVTDGDTDRPDAGVIATFPTLTGYVSVMDSVLLPIPFSTAFGKAPLPLPTQPPAPLPLPTQPPAPLPLPTQEPVTETPAATASLAPEASIASRDPDVAIPPTSGPTDDNTSDDPTSSDEADMSPMVSPEESAAPVTSPVVAASTTTPAPPSDDPACFPADANVHLADGTTVRMDELRAGHTVRSHPADAVGSRVFLFSHRDTAPRAEFVRLETASGHVVRATAGHYARLADGKLRAFGAVRVGDVMRTTKGDSKVAKVATVVGRGLFAPHAMRSEMVVDGVVVSAYSTAVHPRWAEAMLAPVRLAARIGLVEPLGRLLYSGADGLVGVLPRGAEVY